jgi:hypothetical protein
MDIIGQLSEELIRVGVRTWREFYKLRPGLTITLTVIAISLLCTGGYFAYQSAEARRIKAEQEHLANLDLNEQLEKLNEVQRNLNNLLKFIEDQRKKVSTEQEIIQRLQAERSLLEPIVNTDRQVLEAVLKAQEEHSKRDRWKDILIGFMGGFVSEIVVAIILAPWLIPIINRLRARQKAPTDENKSDAGAD